ncbi:MAG TPA: glycosyltransferase, partial [Patescibacteria group bacterium]
PNGIDFENIQKVKSAKDSSGIVFAGRLLSNKNVDFFIKTVNQVKNIIPHVKAIIIGDGPERPKLKKMIKKLNLEKNVEMLGFLEHHNDLYSLMKSSKVFVFPSTREGFGIAALEANAAGIPVITTNHRNNATKDLITNGVNGYALPMKEDIFSEKVIGYITSKPRTSIYKDFAKNYDWDILTEKIKEIYQ